MRRLIHGSRLWSCTGCAVRRSFSACTQTACTGGLHAPKARQGYTLSWRPCAPHGCTSRVCILPCLGCIGRVGKAQQPNLKTHRLPQSCSVVLPFPFAPPLTVPAGPLSALLHLTIAPESMSRQRPSRRHLRQPGSWHRTCSPSGEEATPA